MNFKITKDILNLTMLKNGRARKRMARRMMRKAYESNVRKLGVNRASNKLFTQLELQMNEIIDKIPKKASRRRAKRIKDIERSVNLRLNQEWENLMKYSAKS